jgi:hypothetical protein
MRRGKSVLLIVVLLGLATMLSACESFDMDKFDIFNLNEKKKIPGDRKPLFPEGVPGVSQGVPPELVLGHQPAPDTAQAAPAVDPKAAAVVAEKPKPKRKLKPRVVSQPTQVTVQPAARPAAQPAAQGQPTPQPQAQWPAPGQQPAPQGAQGGQAPWPSTAQQPSAWPTSPSPGTFQR